MILFNLQQKYKLEIRDPSQPMLISRLKMKDVRGQRIEDEQECLLVPELCFATGKFTKHFFVFQI